MESKELIQALRADAEWAHANEWETPITLGDHLDAAADALATLLAEVRRLNSELQLEDTETKPDEKCREDDGCPIENAVLRREWRKLTAQLASVTAERDAMKERTHADVAPVVHGEWVEAKLNGMSLYPDGQKMCSICGQIMPSQWETMPPFCYGCGALMDDDRIV